MGLKGTKMFTLLVFLSLRKETQIQENNSVNILNSVNTLQQAKRKKYYTQNKSFLRPQIGINFNKRPKKNNKAEN